jgi:hypothetical protein
MGYQWANAGHRNTEQIDRTLINPRLPGRLATEIDITCSKPDRCKGRQQHAPPKWRTMEVMEMTLGAACKRSSVMRQSLPQLGVSVGNGMVSSMVEAMAAIQVETGAGRG